jgi:hypothetical protein
MRLRTLTDGDSTRRQRRRRGDSESARTTTDSASADRQDADRPTATTSADSRRASRRASHAMGRLFAGDTRHPPVTDDPRLEREAAQAGGNATATAIRRRLADTDARLHTGPDAARTADRIDAHAFTVGRDVGFARGAFAPETPAGRRLIGHELAHVEQQTAGRAAGVQRQATGTTKPEEEEETPTSKTKPTPHPTSTATPQSSKSADDTQSGPAALGEFDESARKRVRANTDVIAGQDRIDMTDALNGPDSVSNTDVRVTGADDAGLRTALSKAGIYAVSRNLLKRDETTTLALDLTPITKQLAGYTGPMRIAARFSHVGTFGSAHSTITVENLGKLDGSGRKSVQTAGKTVATKRGFGFTGFGKPEQAMIYEALGMLPASVLTKLSEGTTPLTFRRESVSKSEPKAGGHYEQATHTIVLFDTAFQPSQRRYGEGGRFVTETVRVVAHEIGHAVAETEPRVAREAERGRSTAKTKRSRRKATSATGWRWGITTEKGKRVWDYQHETTKTDFVRALKADATRPEKGKKKGAVSITDYPTTYSATGDKLREMYAESFSLYVTDPETLRLLRPNVYAYFETRFGSSATASEQGSKSGDTSK